MASNSFAKSCLKQEKFERFRFVKAGITKFTMAPEKRENSRETARPVQLSITEFSSLIFTLYFYTVRANYGRANLVRAKIKLIKRTDVRINLVKCRLHC